MTGVFGPRCVRCGGYEIGPQHHDPGGLTPARWHRFLPPHTPGTDYYDGRDGEIEAEDDDEERIAGDREGWQDYLEWQRTSH